MKIDINSYQIIRGNNANQQKKAEINQSIIKIGQLYEYKQPSDLTDHERATILFLIKRLQYTSDGVMQADHSFGHRIEHTEATIIACVLLYYKFTQDGEYSSLTITKVNEFIFNKFWLTCDDATKNTQEYFNKINKFIANCYTENQIALPDTKHDWYRLIAHFNIKPVERKYHSLKDNQTAGLKDHLNEGFIVYNSGVQPNHSTGNGALWMNGTECKITPYKDITERFQKNNVLYLNGTCQDKYSNKIACRQIAFYHLQRPNKIRKISKEIIAANQFLMENSFDRERIINKADNYCYFSLIGTSFGEAIHDVCSNSQQEFEKFNVYSENHAMTLMVHRKPDGTYKLSFINPTETNKVVRILCKDMESIRNLSLTYLLSQGFQNIYFPTYKSGVLLHYKNPNEDFKLKKKTTQEIQKMKYDINDMQGNIAQLCFAFNMNKPAFITKYMEHLQSLPHLQLLGNYLLADTSRLLYMALQDGNTESIAAFMQGMVNLCKELPTWVLLIINFSKMLLASHDGTTTGLNMALQNGNTESIAAFMQGMLDLCAELKSSPGVLQKIDFPKILLAFNGVNTTGLYIALHNGNTESIAAFMQGMIALCKILPLDILQEIHLSKILLALNGGNETGLFIALHNGNTESIAAFMEGMLDLCAELKSSPGVLQKIHFSTILFAFDNRKITGLYMALQDGHTASITAFMQGMVNLCAALKLSSQEVLRQIDLSTILLAFDNRKITGLYIALQRGNTESIAAFMKGMVNLYKILPPEILQKIDFSKILLAPNDSNRAGLYVALQNGNTESINTYIKLYCDICEQLPDINPNMLKNLNQNMIFKIDNGNIHGAWYYYFKKHALPYEIANNPVLIAEICQFEPAKTAEYIPLEYFKVFGFASGNDTTEQAIDNYIQAMQDVQKELSALLYKTLNIRALVRWTKN